MTRQQLQDNGAEHIGDGVYAYWNGYACIVATERENGWHWMEIDPSALAVLQTLAQPR